MTTVLLYWQVCNELLARYFKPVMDEVVEKVEEAMEEGEIEPPPGLGDCRTAHCTASLR